MGKIFGISDLPVETIADVVKPGRSLVPKPIVQTVQKSKNYVGDTVKFLKPVNTPRNKSNYKHGFGKLLSIFKKSKENTLT